MSNSLSLSERFKQRVVTVAERVVGVKRHEVGETELAKLAEIYAQLIANRRRISIAAEVLPPGLFNHPDVITQLQQTQARSGVVEIFVPHQQVGTNLESIVVLQQAGLPVFYHQWGSWIEPWVEAITLLDRRGMIALMRPEGKLTGWEQISMPSYLGARELAEQFQRLKQQSIPSLGTR